MIILTKDKGVVIPDYNDLENKPKINGVTLEGDLTTEELGIDWDAARYYTKTESDDRFQPKGDYQPAGDYLTNVPSEYITETELNEALAGLDGNDIPYVCILLNQSGIKEYIGDLQAVIEAVKNKTPYLAYARTFDDPNDYGTELGSSRTTIPLTATYNNNEGTSGYKTGNFGYHTELASHYNYPHLDVKINFEYDDTTESYILTSVSKLTHNYLTLDYYNSRLLPSVLTRADAETTYQQILTSGENIKTINGESLLGSGDLTIEGGGTTDLSNYYTKTEIDAKIGDINTILENIIG